VDGVPVILKHSLKFNPGDHVAPDMGDHPLLSARGGPASPRTDMAAGSDAASSDATLNPMRASRVLALGSGATNAPITASLASVEGVAVTVGPSSTATVT